MTTINLSIDLTTEQLTGVSQARTAYNLANNATLTDSEYLEFVLLGAANSYIEQFSGSQGVEPSPIAPQPNWGALLLHLASGDLYALFERNREVAESSTSVALYRGDIVSAITTIKREEFLASGLGLLRQRAGYEFTEQEVADWNRVTEELGFSQLVRI